MMKSTMLILTILGFLVSCSNSEKYERISGDWECTSWINESRGIDKCNNNVHFRFQPDKSYYSTLGIEKDSGNYRIERDILYVTPKGKMEFGVKIIELNNDTLEFLMNQVGEKEILTLKRVKK